MPNVCALGARTTRARESSARSPHARGARRSQRAARITMTRRVGALSARAPARGRAGACTCAACARAHFVCAAHPPRPRQAARAAQRGRRSRNAHIRHAYVAHAHSAHARCVRACVHTACIGGVHARAGRYTLCIRVTRTRACARVARESCAHVAQAARVRGVHARTTHLWRGRGAFPMHLNPGGIRAESARNPGRNPGGFSRPGIRPDLDT